MAGRNTQAGRHRIVRYADDILILSSSKRAAENAFIVARNYLEGDLQLNVNERKTRIIHSREGVYYLLSRIETGYLPQNY